AELRLGKLDLRQFWLDLRHIRMRYGMRTNRVAGAIKCTNFVPSHHGIVQTQQRSVQLTSSRLQKVFLRLARELGAVLGSLFESLQSLLARIQRPNRA